MDKRHERETARVTELKTRLGAQLKEFEDRYALSTSEFFGRFNRGELGDSIDFIEWSATLGMVENLDE